MGMGIEAVADIEADLGSDVVLVSLPVCEISPAQFDIQTPSSNEPLDASAHLNSVEQESATASDTD